MCACKVIAVMNPKGGVGKSLTSATISAVLTERYKNVLCIDTDPQKTLTEFYGNNPSARFQVNYISIAAIGTAVSQLREKVKYIVIDTQGSSSSMLEHRFRGIIAASDLIVIPMQTTRVDFNPTKPLVKGIRDFWETKTQKKPKSLFVLNRCDESSAGARAQRHRLALIDDFQTAKTSFRPWHSVGTLFDNGQTLLDDRRFKEIGHALVNEIEGLINE